MPRVSCKSQWEAHALSIFDEAARHSHSCRPSPRRSCSSGRALRRWRATGARLSTPMQRPAAQRGLQTSLQASPPQAPPSQSSGCSQQRRGSASSRLRSQTPSRRVPDPDSRLLLVLGPQSRNRSSTPPLSPSPRSTPHLLPRLRSATPSLRRAARCATLSVCCGRCERHCCRVTSDRRSAFSRRRASRPSRLLRRRVRAGGQRQVRYLTHSFPPIIPRRPSSARCCVSSTTARSSRSWRAPSAAGACGESWGRSMHPESQCTSCGRPSPTPRWGEGSDDERGESSARAAGGQRGHASPSCLSCGGAACISS